jgi:uncharacterized membrane protein
METRASSPPAVQGSAPMALLVGYILLTGVIVSVALIASGLLWHYLRAGTFALEYPTAGVNLFQFVLTDVRLAATRTIRPRLLVSLGIAVLLITPYVRVLASMLYFALVERNRKYALFTGFVLAVLTYSLFLR